MGPVLLGITIFFVLLTALLVVPIDVAFKIERIEKLHGQLRFYWLFGLVRFRVGIPGTAKAEPQQKPTKKTRQRKQTGNAPGVFALLKQSAFRRHVIRFIKDMLRATHARDLYLRLRIGLGDPADTGRLWALLGPVAGMAANLRHVEVRIEPEFIDPVLEVESHGAFRLVPLQFVALATAFVLSPTTRRSWRAVRRNNV